MRDEGVLEWEVAQEPQNFLSVKRLLRKVLF